MFRYVKLTFIAIILCGCVITVNSQTKHTVTATYYYVGHNCGHVTADGSRINNSKVSSGEHRWVALSRDMFTRHGYELGDIIHVESKNPILCGEWIVRDKMGARHRNRIDFLMTKEKGKKHFRNPHKVTIRKIKSHKPAKKKKHRK